MAPGPARSMEDRSQHEAVVLFDGFCAFCSRSVRFIIERDPGGRFRFAPIESPAAKRLLAACTPPPESVDSLVLVEDGRCFVRSAAAMRIARRLSGLWPALCVLRLCPRPLRDCGYDAFARNRYRWFGRNDACYAPSPEERGRFLD